MLRLTPLLFLLLACGGASASRGARPIDLAPHLTPGAVYEIHHRERRQLDDEAPRTVRTHVLVEVRERLPDGGLRMRAQLVRSAHDTGTDPHLVSTLVDFDLTGAGDIHGAARVRCPTGDDLRIARFLRFLLSARTIVADGLDEGATWRSPVYSDAVEFPASARWRVDAIDRDSVDGRFVARLQMDDGDVGLLRVTGEGRVRGRFHVRREDGFSGHTLIDTLVRGDIIDPLDDRRTHGTVRVRTDIMVRPAQEDWALAEGCDRYDSSIIVSAIRARAPAIQGCYEGLLAEAPTLRGRTIVRFRADPDGRLRAITIAENTSGEPALGECVVTMIEGLRLRPAPVSPVTYHFPFVFAAER